MKRLMTCFFLLTAFLGRAQPTDFEEARRQMIRAAVAFYASDPALNKNKVSVPANAAKESVLKAAEQMDGVLRTIQPWYVESIGNCTQLQALHDKIFMAVDKKGARRSLPSRPGFDAQMKALLCPAAQTAAKLAVRTVPPTHEVTITPAVVTGQPDGQNEPLVFGWMGINTMAAVMLGALLVTLLVVLSGFSRLNSNVRQVKDVITNINRRTSVYDDALRDQQKFVPASTPANTGSVQVLELRIQELGDKLSKLSQVHAAALDAAAAPSVAEPEALRPAKPTEKAADTQVFFAKRPDLGDGFSNDALYDDQNGELVYEISVRGNSATFDIAREERVQRFALSDPDAYLRNGCTFTNEPVRNCIIRSKEPGKLVKKGRDWSIEKKVTIAFTA